MLSFEKTSSLSILEGEASQARIELARFVRYELDMPDSVAEVVERNPQEQKDRALVLPIRFELATICIDISKLGKHSPLRCRMPKWFQTELEYEGIHGFRVSMVGNDNWNAPIREDFLYHGAVLDK